MERVGNEPGNPSHRSSRHSGRAVAAAAVLAAAGWAMLVPYLGPAWELTASVPARVEVVDHIVPGALAGLAAALCLLRRDRGAAARPVAEGQAAPAQP